MNDADVRRRAEVMRTTLRERPRSLEGRVFRSALTAETFCRPTCRTRVPAASRLQVYKSAAEALLDGKQPCPRCRPEAGPDHRQRHAEHPALARALVLLAQPTSHSDSAESLARALSTDASRLRELFVQQLGVTPAAHKRGVRLALAHNLRRDATLSATQIARASGVRDDGHLPAPLASRPAARLATGQARRRRSGAPTFTLALGYSEPFDWRAMLAFFRARAIPGIERVDDDAYERTLALDGAHGRLQVRDADGERLQLTVELTEPRALPRVVARVQRMFDLHADPLIIGAHLAQDPHLAPLVERRPGLRVPGAWDPFETALRAILGQQVSVSAAVKLASRLVAMLGAPLLAPLCRDDGLTHVFPTAQRVADAGELRLGMPGARARALTTLARAALEQPALLMPACDLDTSLARLLALPGIGDWTAHYIALRALHEADAFPAGDVGLQRTLLGADGTRPSAAALREQAQAWRPWRAYAAQHLWAADPGLPQQT